MWSRILEPGLTLLSGTRRNLRGFSQELCHHAVHEYPGTVLWCDGDHGFDPYHMAEMNLERGRQADDGADRVLIKRCMTPFQWDTVLTKHLDEKLLQIDASVIAVAPFDRLFSTDELQDWEQEDYTRFALNHLKNLTRRYQIPILLSVDMERWWRTHPVLAQATYEATHNRWNIDAPDGRWRAISERNEIIDPWLRRQVTLLDFIEEEVLRPIPLANKKRRAELDRPMRSWRNQGVRLPVLKIP